MHPQQIFWLFLLSLLTWIETPHSSFAKDDELTRMFVCQKNLHILMLGTHDRASYFSNRDAFETENKAVTEEIRTTGGTAINKKSLGNWEKKALTRRAEFFPGIRNGHPGFYGIQGEVAVFFPTPEKASRMENGNPVYDLELDMNDLSKLQPPHETSIIQWAFTSREQLQGEKFNILHYQSEIEMKKGYAYFQADPVSRNFIPKTLSILSDPDQKGNRDTLPVSERTYTAHLQKEVTPDTAARDAFAGRIADYLNQDESPSFTDFSRRNIPQNNSLGSKDGARSFALNNIVQSFQYDWEQGVREQNEKSSIRLTYLPKKQAEEIFNDYFSLLKVCETVEAPAIKEALKKAYARIAGYLHQHLEPIPKNAPSLLSGSTADAVKH